VFDDVPRKAFWKSQRELKPPWIEDLTLMSDIAGRHVKAKNKTRAPIQTVTAEQMPERPRGYFRTMAEEIAGHRLYSVNYHVDVLQKEYPNKFQMWSVDRWFPYSKNGKLAVDEPMYDPDIQESKAKQKTLAAHGIRMLIITPGMTLNDAYEQLAEVETWLGQHP
jgi:hypothetical protein